MEIIHIVLGKANPNRMNGVNKVVHQLASKQALSGQSVSVWGITKDLTENYGERPFQTRLFKANVNPFALPYGLKAAFSSVQKKAVVHIHGGWIPVFSGISALLKNLEIPFVFTPHGAYNTVAMERSALIKKLYFRFFEKKVLRNSSRIHCLGASEVKGLGSIFKNDKSVLLPYGFEKEPTQHSHQASLNRNFIVGFVGRTDVYTKGLDLLLEAFGKFAKEHPASQLWIVGDGPEQSKLAQMAEKAQLGEQCIFWGSRFGEEKENLMKQMDLFAHPSRNEGLPSSILEACAMGIPSLVTEATNLAEMVRQYQCGKAIEDNNAEALYVALKDLYADWQQGDFKEMGIQARHMVLTEFNWNTLLKRFEKMYATL